MFSYALCVIRMYGSSTSWLSQTKNNSLVRLSFMLLQFVVFYCVPGFNRNMLLLKSWYTTRQLHGATTQKTNYRNSHHYEHLKYYNQQLTCSDANEVPKTKGLTILCLVKLHFIHIEESLITSKMLCSFS
jgi:hypothetical protein